MNAIAARWRGTLGDAWPGVVLACVIAVASAFVAENRGGPTHADARDAFSVRPHILVWYPVRFELAFIRGRYAVVLALLPGRRAGHPWLQHSRHLTNGADTDDVYNAQRACD